MATIEEIRSNIDVTNFENVLSYIDDPKSEFEYIIIVLKGELAEAAIVAINGDDGQWKRQMEDGTVKFMLPVDYKVMNPQAIRFNFDRQQIPKSEYVEVLAVTPGFFIKRRERR